MKADIIPRLVASDLGGTLVPPGKDAVPAATLAVLDEIMAMGIPVAVVTGFNLYTARRMINGLSASPWFLVQNGTLAVRDNQIIWEHGLGIGEAERLVRTLEGMEIPVVVYRNLSRDGIPEYRGFGDFSRGAPFRAVDGYSDFSDISGVSTQIPNHRVGETAAALRECISDQSRLVFSRGRSRTWIEVTPLNANKEQALERLCTELAVEPEQVVFFGDNLNDLEVLNMVGFPRVVADGLPQLRKRFPQVAASSHQGPARELVRIFGLEKPPGL